jgi:hypothetical protein
MHVRLKRNFQVMPGAAWLELLCRQIPDRYEHLVHYVGWYSNRARGERAKALKGQDIPATPAAPLESVSEVVARAKAAWARLIRKVYEADPLECPKCQGPMRVIALMGDPALVRRILEHLGRWARDPAARAPPVRTTPPITPFRTSHKTREARTALPLPLAPRQLRCAQPDRPRWSPAGLAAFRFVA